MIDSAVMVGSLQFQATNLDRAAEKCVDAALHRVPVAFRLSNSYVVASADTDRSYADEMNRPESVVLPDGWPVVAAMRIFTRFRVPLGRVRGPSLFLAVLDKGRQARIVHMFVGGDKRVLGELEESLRLRYPGILIARGFAPPFAPLSAAYLDDICDAVAQSKPNFVWIGLGSPKQDYVASEIVRRLGVPTAGVGAAFDFMSGNVREAPKWMQSAGLEWLFRLTQDPARLWRRYVFGGMRFVRVVVRQTFMVSKCSKQAFR